MSEYYLLTTCGLGFCCLFVCRRDSFITHRAFCDVLAEESAKNHTQSKKLYPETVSESQQKSPAAVDSPPPSPSPPPVAPSVSVESETEPEPANIASSLVLPIQDSSGT